jgi:hypothetical protein
MIYLLVGNKTERKQKTQELCKGNIYTTIHPDEVKEKPLSEMLNTQTGMFGDLEYYLIYELARDIKKDELVEYQASENIFIFSEESITKPVRALFEKCSVTFFEFSEEKKETEKKFNIFALSDAFLQRDKKQLWLLFQEALGHVSPEEIHGLLFWQLKNMFMVKISDSNPGLQPFVFTKTKKAIEKFSLEELSGLNQKFVHIFHTRDTLSTLDIELEKLILSL